MNSLLSSAMMGVLLLNVGCATDTINFTSANTSGDIGMLLDGELDGTDVNDDGYVIDPGSPLVQPGDIRSGTSNEFTGFQKDRVPSLRESANWSDDVDVRIMDLPDSYGVPMYVWIVNGSYSDGYDQAVDGCIKLDEVWEEERMGLYISEFNVTDSTCIKSMCPSDFLVHWHAHEKPGYALS
ncbi:MAG: hypothetical protein V3T17_01260 [Pseudomonadales bacterium]